jgi:HEAT repeat protein
MDDRVASTVARLANLVDGPHAYFEVIALGPAAIPALERLARAPATTVHQPRSLAVDALAQIGGVGATDALLRTLADSLARPLDPVLRQAEDVVANRVCEQLGVVGESRVRDALLGVIAAHAYPSCATALARLRETRATPYLARWLGDDTMRDYAADALVSLGVAALRDATRVLVCPRTVAGSEPPSWIDARVSAVAIVGATGGEAADLPLAWALADAQPAVRRAAALAWSARDRAAAEVAAPVLIDGLASESFLDRVAAMDALRGLGRAAVPSLAATLRDLPRDGALAAVHLLGEHAAEHMLGDLHDHPDRHVRWAAVEALRRAGARGELVRFAQDPEREIRKRARS